MKLSGNVGEKRSRLLLLSQQNIEIPENNVYDEVLQSGDEEMQNFSIEENGEDGRCDGESEEEMTNYEPIEHQQPLPSLSQNTANSRARSL